MKTFSLYIKAFIALSVILFIQSCGIGNKPKTPTTPTVKPIPNNVTKSDTVVKYDTVTINKYEKLINKVTIVDGKTIKKDSLRTIVDHNQKRIDSLNDLNNPATIVEEVKTSIKKHSKKTSYNVAILLPFMTNSSKTAENEAKSMRAVEFYEGILLAFDSLRRENINLNINVYDTRDNDSTITSLLALDAVKNADLIIGPITSNELAPITKFSKEREIPIISPLNPRYVLDEGNPNFVQISPSLNTQMQGIFSYLQANFPRRTINYIIVGSKNDSANVLQVAESYKLFTKNANAKVNTYISTTTQFSSEQFGKLIQRNGALNVIIAPTLYETFVFSLLSSLTEVGSSSSTNLNTRVSEEYIVIGLSQWKYFESVNFEYYEKLRLHMASEVYIDLNNPATQRLKDSYFNNYGMAPKDFAYIGFDVMLYAGRLLHKHGTGFMDHITTEKFTGRHTTFQFEPAYLPTETPANTEKLEFRAPDYYENQYLNLLKFEEYMLKKVN